MCSCKLLLIFWNVKFVGKHAVYVCKVHQEGVLDTDQQHLERHRGLPSSGEVSMEVLIKRQRCVQEYHLAKHCASIS